MRRVKFIIPLIIICVLILMVMPIDENAESNFSQYNIELEQIKGDNQLSYSKYPRFEDEAWKIGVNPYSDAYLFGQCTWFAWARFYEIYGYSPGFLGNGYECASQLVNCHRDLFTLSDTPVVGSIGSSDYEHNHVWIVVGVDENGCTIQEGNLDGITNEFIDSLTDWRQAYYTYEQLKKKYGDVIFANPI